MTEYENPAIREQVSTKRLWFGFAGAALAWSLAGLLNVILAWETCMGSKFGTGVFTDAGIRILLGFITFGLLAVSVAAGAVSFRNWRRLSRESNIVEAEGRGREEFMAIFGLIVSISLAVGLVWFAIPIYLLGICQRGR
jgi:hypothetical protein